MQWDGSLRMSSTGQLPWGTTHGMDGRVKKCSSWARCNEILSYLVFVCFIASAPRIGDCFGWKWCCTRSTKRLMPPRSNLVSKGSFGPPNDSATYRDLLLFEERLKTNAANLQRRKKRYQRTSICVQMSYGLMNSASSLSISTSRSHNISLVRSNLATPYIHSLDTIEDRIATSLARNIHAWYWCHCASVFFDRPSLRECHYPCAVLRQRHVFREDCVRKQVSTILIHNVTTNSLPEDTSLTPIVPFVRLTCSWMFANLHCGQNSIGILSPSFFLVLKNPPLRFLLPPLDHPPRLLWTSKDLRLLPDPYTLYPQPQILVGN